jgi:hypothetical protein
MPLNVHSNFIFLGPDNLSPRNQLQLYAAIERQRPANREFNFLSRLQWSICRKP